MRGWLKSGNIVGVACDLDSGRMMVSVNGDFENPSGGIPFDSGPKPGPTVGRGLFPVLTGYHGCKVRCNLGNDLVNRPFSYLAPSSEYTSVAAAAFGRSKVKIFFLRIVDSGTNNVIAEGRGSHERRYVGHRHLHKRHGLCKSKSFLCLRSVIRFYI